MELFFYCFPKQMVSSFLAEAPFSRIPPQSQAIMVASAVRLVELRFAKGQFFKIQPRDTICAT